MELEHYIITHILKWPTLYKRKTYEMSRIAVLDQIFCVIGNGMDWKKSRQGSFITDINGSGKPYVPSLQTEFPPNYFDNFDDIVEETDTKFLNNLGLTAIDLERIKNEYIKRSIEMYIKSANRAVAPYTISEYSAIHEMLMGKTNSPHIKNFELKKIKPDWIAGAVDMATYALNFYRDPTKWRLCYYHPEYNKGNISGWEKSWDDAIKKNELAKWKQDRNMPETISTPLEAAQFSWEAHKKEQIEILEKFLEKFKN